MADRPSYVLRQSVARCQPCDKASYATRKAAKAALANGPLQAERAMREYRCPHRRDYWHIGHLPPAVITGRSTAAEVYRKPSKRPS